MFRPRRFAPGDAATIAVLFHETVRAVAARDYSPEQIAAWSPGVPTGAAWQSRFLDTHTLLAETPDGTVAGFANLEPMAGVDRAGHLNMFYTHKDYQGVGVGTILLSALEAEAHRRGYAHLFLEASITARPFFSQRGFIVIVEQTVQRGDISLTNFRMVKKIVPDQP